VVSTGVGTSVGTFALAANEGPNRTGHLTISGQVLTVNQGSRSPSPYDGRWTGTGKGESFSSGAAIMEITLVITDGIIGSVDIAWRFDTAPGAPIPFCSGNAFPGFIQISLGAFVVSFNTFPNQYHYTMSGVFSSTSAVSGTLRIEPLDAPPQCLGATMNWSATKQS
jgi:hypothetical protein